MVCPKPSASMAASRSSTNLTVTRKVPSTAVNGIRLDVPSIKGNTGILDLGVAYQPARLTNLQFNHGAKGYVGDREGASVNFIAVYAF